MSTRLARQFRIVPSRVAGARTLPAYLDLGLVGDRGAITLRIDLDWRRGDIGERISSGPAGVAVDVHARGWRRGFPMSELACDWLGRCVSLRLSAELARFLATVARDDGDARLWEELEELYARWLPAERAAEAVQA